MARVEWSRRSGDEVESVIAIMLCREYPHARRIRPASGDDGIDVLVPVAGGIEVYQVKKHALNLTGGQKGKIKNSFKRISEYSAASGRNVVAWHLTLPLNPTPGNEVWFQELTSDAPFTCDWRGLDFVDGFASKYQDVIDYYLRDGKDRLVATLRDLAEASGFLTSPDPDATMQPADARAGLAAVHQTLNSIDPHFRYDFSVDSTPPDLTEFPDVVFAETAGQDDCYVTYRVYARYDEALNDRPITVSVRIAESSDEEFKSALEDFYQFGAPLTTPPDVVEFSSDAPGGLLGHARGRLTVGPTQEQSIPNRRYRMRVLNPEGEPLAQCVMDGYPPTVGLAGRGTMSISREINECFEFQCRIESGVSASRANVNFVFKLLGVEGKAAAEVVSTVRLIGSLTSVNGLQFGAEFGPFESSVVEIPGGVEPLVTHGFVEYVASLARLQELTSSTLRVPQLADVTQDELDAVLMAGQLLDGKTVPVNCSPMRAVWNGQPIDGDPHSVFLMMPYSVVANGIVIDVGNVGFYSPAVLTKLDSDEELAEAGVTEWTILPLDGEKVSGTLRLYE